MSNNPKTKSYWKKVNKLDRDFSLRHQGGSVTREVISQIVKKSVPTASARMVHQALERAYEDSERALREARAERDWLKSAHFQTAIPIAVGIAAGRDDVVDRPFIGGPFE